MASAHAYTALFLTHTHRNVDGYTLTISKFTHTDHTSIAHTHAHTHTSKQHSHNTPTTHTHTHLPIIIGNAKIQKSEFVGSVLHASARGLCKLCEEFALEMPPKPPREPLEDDYKYDVIYVYIFSNIAHTVCLSLSLAPSRSLCLSLSVSLSRLLSAALTRTYTHHPSYRTESAWAWMGRLQLPSSSPVFLPDYLRHATARRHLAAGPARKERLCAPGRENEVRNFQTAVSPLHTPTSTYVYCP